MAESNPADEAVMNFISKRKNSVDVLFSVCSGAFFLGEAGLLDGKRATTFASLIPTLKLNYPDATVVDNVKYVDNGQVVTSAGLSSGIDASFHVVSKYYGVGRAQDIANHMEYPWKRENDYARSQLADNFILSVREIVGLFSSEYFYSKGNENLWEYRYLLSDQFSTDRIIEILTRELNNNISWKQGSSGKGVISGVITHNSLGEDKVSISIMSTSENGRVGVITSERQNALME